MDLTPKITDVLYLPGVVVLYGVASYTCKWIFGKHIHQFILKGTDVEKRFVDDIIDDCSGVVAKEANQSRETARHALRALFEKSDNPEILSNLLRVDYDVEKTSSVECRLRIHMLFRSGQDGKKITVQRTIRWEWLPDAIRSTFIKDNSDKQAFVLVARETLEAQQQTQI